MVAGDPINVVWQLRTHPFAPTTGSDGKPLDPRNLRRPLDPRSDVRLLHYYFDHYDWSRSPGVGEIVRIGERQALSDPTRALPDTEKALAEITEALPEITTLRENDTAHLVVIYGLGEGHRSLRNLIDYWLTQAYQGVDAPIFIHAPVDYERNEGALKAFARFFVREAPRREPTLDQPTLDTIVERGVRDATDARGYRTIFNLLKSEVRDNSQRPIVAHVEGGEHYATWEILFRATEGLVNLMVVTTSSRAHVDSLRTQFLNKANQLSVIQAKKLDLGMARDFLRARMASHRLQDSGPLDMAPFTEEGLQALYARSDQAQPGGEPVEYSIRRLCNMFRSALDKHAVAQQDAPQPLISVQQMLDYVDAQNRGR